MNLFESIIKEDLYNNFGLQTYLNIHFYLYIFIILFEEKINKKSSKKPKIL